MTEEELKGVISYLKLVEIIYDYFMKTEGVGLGRISIDYLQEKLLFEDNTPPFFIRNDGFGEVRFDIPKEYIEKIIKLYFANMNCELISELEYWSDDKIIFNYRYNPNIKSEMNKPENKFELDLNYNGSIQYFDLRQIIFDYYENVKGIKLGSISIDYLHEKLVSEYQTQPFFIRNDKFGETRFDIPKEEIQEIVKEYITSKGCELTSELEYADNVMFKYKKLKKKEQEKNTEEIINTGDEPLELSQVEEVSPVESPEESTIVVYDELTKMAREKRKFTILQRERAMNEAQQGKTRSAVMAGLCILGTIVSVYFNDQDVHQAIYNELNSIYSWEALGRYIQDLGPLTTLLIAGAGGFISNYLKHSRKLKKAQHELEDFNASLENSSFEELGGNEHVRTR